MDKRNLVRKLRQLVLLLPISVLYISLIGGGLYIMIKESFGYIPKLGFRTWTLNYYTSVFEMNGFGQSVFYSIAIASISAILSMLIGTLLAYKIMQSNNKHLKATNEILMRFGLILPYLYMIFMVMLFFGQSGVISRLVYHIGIIDKPNDFPSFIYGAGGIVLTFVLKGIPFVMLLTLNVMTKVSKDYDDVAKTLGANSKAILKKIYLPLIKDTLVWAGMVLFAYDLGAFEVPYILSTLKSQTLSMKLYSTFISPNIADVPLVMSMAVIFFFIGIISVILFALVNRFIIRRLSQ